ncbi:MAG TPA: ABC transporter substrate-binding protein [Rhodocyclaceae bacterium]|nr:ABC transporter substrate-binding protein [Rhodocyclaceae bacterium]
MSRIMRPFLCLMCCAALALPAVAQAHNYTVMLMLYRGVTDAERGFMEYLKGRLPVDFLVRDAGGDESKIADFVTEAKRIRPDLIYTFGTTVTADVVGEVGKIDPARNITDIPVVFNIVADPVGANLTKVMQGSNRNLTGVSHLVPMPAQLALMEHFKRVTRLGAVFNPQEANSTLAIQDLRNASKQFGFELVAEGLDVAKGEKPTPQAIVEATQKVIAAKVDFIYLPSDSSLIQQATLIVAPATTAGIPVISATEAPIRSNGALVGLVSNYYNAGTFAAYKAEQILLKKQNANDIPIETLQRFSLLINMGAARSLQLYPPLNELKFAELLD